VNLELKEVVKSEDSKLAKVRGAKHKGKKKNVELLRSIQRFLAK
jgi:hypothetical protein